jgi:hypothetical protein
VAEDLVFDHLIRWRLRNLIPHDRDIERLAAAWRDNRPPPTVRRVTLAPDHRESFAEDARLRIAHRILLDSASRDEVLSPRADLHLISGNYAAAAAAYQAEISTGAGSPESWAGLAVARRRLVKEDRDALILRPELVRAIHDRLSVISKQAPSPLDISRWFTPVCLDQIGSASQELGGVHLPVKLEAPRNRIPPGGLVLY